MSPTMYPHINMLLDSLLTRIKAILGQKLAALYLYGSLVTGDFDNETSDLDLLAVTTHVIDSQEFNALHKLHDAFAVEHEAWKDRLEIAYVSLHGLKTFHSASSKIGIISPGEPFHIIDAGKDWLVNWYVVRGQGVTLFGPPPTDVIDPISSAEFVDTIKSHLRGWREWVNDAHTRPAQAYAILTMCRALYTVTTGEQVSKKRAALWTAARLPEWATLIHNALAWRQDWRAQNIDYQATQPETQRFVHFMIDYILS